MHTQCNIVIVNTSEIYFKILSGYKYILYIETANLLNLWWISALELSLRDKLLYYNFLMQDCYGQLKILVAHAAVFSCN